MATDDPTQQQTPPAAPPAADPATDPSSVRTPPQTPPPAGLLSHLATVLGIDPGAVETAAKAFYAHPVTAAKEVAQQAYEHPETAAGNAAIGTPHGIGQDIVRDVTQGITDPEKRLGLVTGMVQPGSAFPEGPFSDSELEGTAKGIAEKLYDHFKKTTGSGVPDEASTLNAKPPKAQPLGASAEPAKAPTSHEDFMQQSREHIAALRKLGYTNQQIDNINVAELNTMLKTPASEWKPTPDREAHWKQVLGTEEPTEASQPAEAAPEANAHAATEANALAAPPETATPEAEAATPVKISTDSVGVKWAENEDGIRVSIPKSVAPEDVPEYAQQKIAEQAKMQADFKASREAESEAPESHITFEDAGSTEVQPPDMELRAALSHDTPPMSDAEREQRIENLQSLVQSPNSLEAKNARDILQHAYGIQSAPVDFTAAYGDDGHAVANTNDLFQSAVAPETEPEDIVQSAKKSRENPLPNNYEVTVHTPGGEPQVVTVQAFSHRAALETAQKNFPDATEWGITGITNVAPPAGYSVPTNKLLSLPKGAGEPIAVMKHELGHALVDLREGLTTKGIMRHTHPDVPSDASATAVVSGEGLYKPGTRDIKDDKLIPVVRGMLGGVAADEVFNNTPRARNPNMNLAIHGSDGEQTYRFLRAAGYSPEAALARMHSEIDYNREYLASPAASSVVNENAGVREPGLSRQYHHSPERLESMHAEIQRRMQNESENSNAQAVSRGRDQDGAENVAGAEGETASGDRQDIQQQKEISSPGQTAIRNLEKAPFNADLRPIDYPESAKFTNRTAPAMILPDGRIVNARLSHREIANAAGYKGDADGLTHFLHDTGAVRVIYPEFTGEHSIGIEMHQPPNDEQLRIIGSTIKRAKDAGLGDGQVAWDLGSGNNRQSGHGSIGAWRRAVDAWTDKSGDLQQAAKRTDAEKTAIENQVAAHKANGGSTFTPEGQNMLGADLYSVGSYPERGKTVGELTPKVLQQFKKNNADVLAKPDHAVGTWKDPANGKVALDIVKTYADKDEAISAGKAANQKAIFHLGSGETIDTGGTGEGSIEPGDRVSTRFPSAVSSPEDPMYHNLRLSTDDLLKTPAIAQRIADKLIANNKSLNLTPEDRKSPAATFNAFKQQFEDNTVATYERARDRGDNSHLTNRVWYQGGNAIGTHDAATENLLPRQTIGVLASQSPQKDWNQNVSLYERILDTVLHKNDVSFTPEMAAKGKDFIANIAEYNQKRVAAGKHPVNPWIDKALIKGIRGKSFAELTDPTQKAAWLRLYDEAHNPREFHEINPDGSKGDVVRTLAGEPEKVAWGGLDSIAKAISMVEDGSRENISRQLGENHKVRSFYNNLVEPDAPTNMDVTADTHHVGLSHMRVISGDDPETKLNFGANGSSITGAYGSYPLYADAARSAMTRINKMHPEDPPLTHPHQLQAVTWVEWRKSFPPEFRNEETRKVVDSIWKEHLDGKISADEARQRVFAYADELHARVHEGAQHPADQTELFGRGVHGSGAARGGGSQPTARDSGVNDAHESDEGDTSFNFGANEK